MVEQSDRQARIVRIKVLAKDVLGDEAKAGRWLNESLGILNGATPLEVLQMEGGAEFIEQVLAKIDWGAPA